MPRGFSRYNNNQESDRWYERQERLEREYNNYSNQSPASVKSRSSRSSMGNLPSRKIPKNAKNTITEDDIMEGNTMANFHGEFNAKRYYKKSTVKQLLNGNSPKNPYTRAPLVLENVTYYKVKNPKTRRYPISRRKRGTRRIRHI
jgi:hypothetical protein